MKKRKNYLFEKLLRNQFLPKNKILNSKGKGIKRNKSGAALSSEANNYQEEINKVLVSEKKLSKMRERSGSNYLKKRIIKISQKKLLKIQEQVHHQKKLIKQSQK